MNERTANHETFLRSVNLQLLVALILMISGYFTWNENVLITQAFKVFSRMSSMGAAWYICQRILRYGAVDVVGWRRSTPFLLYLGYLLLGFASIMWSTKPSYSALQWFMTFQSLFFCYFMVKSLALLDAFFPGHKARMFNLLGNASFVLITVFIIGMWVDPNTFFRMTAGGTEARLGGYMMNPNELGMLAGVGVAGLVFDLRRNHKKVVTLLKIALLLYGLYATGSRSSLIGVFLVIGLQVLHSGNKKLRLGLMVALFLAMGFGAKEVIFKDGSAERMEEVMSMTGRLPFWTALINEGLPREPWLGFGFMRIDYNEFFQGVHTYPGKMTHNTFLQVLMNLGFIGFGWVMFQLGATMRSIGSLSPEQKGMLWSLMVPIFINSLTEFGIFGESNYGILFYQLVIFSVCLAPSRRPSRVQSLLLSKRRPGLRDSKTGWAFPEFGK